MDFAKLGKEVKIGTKKGEMLKKSAKGTGDFGF